jgi:hypothetical protein
MAWCFLDDAVPVGRECIVARSGQMLRTAVEFAVSSSNNWLLKGHN